MARGQKGDKGKGGITPLIPRGVTMRLVLTDLEPTELLYQPATAVPWRRRRWTRRVIRWGVVALAVVVLGLWVPGFYDRLQFLRTQRRAVTSPMILTGQMLLSTANTTQPAVSTTTLDRQFWNAWRRTQPSYPTQLSGTPLFFGRMATASGDDRLVAIYASLIAPTVLREGELRIDTFAYDLRGTAWAVWPRLDKRKDMFSLMGLGRLTVRLRPNDQLAVSGIATDPADASHLRVPYVLNGRAGAIDAHLVDARSSANEPRVGLDFDRRSGILSTHGNGGSGVTPP